MPGWLAFTHNIWNRETITNVCKGQRWRNETKAVFKFLTGQIRKVSPPYPADLLSCPDVLFWACSAPMFVQDRDAVFAPSSRDAPCRGFPSETLLRGRVRLLLHFLSPWSPSEAHLGLLFPPETATIPSLRRQRAGLPLIGIGIVSLSWRCRYFRLMSSSELAWLINNSLSQQTSSLQGSWACLCVKHVLCWPLYSASISTLTYIVDTSVLMR